MFFDDRKGGGGIAGAILTSNKDGTLTNKPKEEATGAPDHELLVQELHDAVHSRDTQGTYDAMHALFAHFRANEGAGE